MAIDIFTELAKLSDMEATMSVAEMIEAAQKKAEQGPWIPACGGTETPFLTRSGRKLLYCWQPSTGNHAYLDCNTDIILTNEEAWLAMGNR